MNIVPSRRLVIRITYFSEGGLYALALSSSVLLPTFDKASAQHDGGHGGDHFQDYIAGTWP